MILVTENNLLSKNKVRHRTIHQMMGPQTQHMRELCASGCPLQNLSVVAVLNSCMINPGENEALVRHASDKYKYLSLAPPQVSC